jgi:YidC/Oxa1 family membrane protein insertase
MIHFFYVIFFIPIYNLLIFITGIVPAGDIGLAVVLVTLIIKILTSPLSLSAVKTQRQMKRVKPNLKHIKEKYKDDKEKQARETMALYKNNDIHPFASIFGALIQLPIIISLYQIFLKEKLLQVDVSILYSFIKIPDVISPLFLNTINVVGHSLVLTLIATAAQFLQAWLSIQIPVKNTANAGTGDEFARAMSIQARYVLPLFIGFISYTSGAVALYFITSSLFSVAQELYIRKIHPLTPAEVATV